ncbi:MAG: hypothetical protein ACK4RK_00190 [Gemmataceae bacterium]
MIGLQATPLLGLSFDDPLAAGKELLTYFWIALGVIFIGAMVVVFVDRWRRRSFFNERSASNDLTTFRALFEQGEISKEEYDRIRSLVGQRLRHEWDLPDKQSRPASGAGTDDDEPPIDLSAAEFTPQGESESSPASDSAPPLGPAEPPPAPGSDS